MLAANGDLRRVYVCTVYLFIQLRGGELTREKVRGAMLLSVSPFYVKLY